MKLGFFYALYFNIKNVKIWNRYIYYAFVECYTWWMGILNNLYVNKFDNNWSIFIRFTYNNEI